MTDKPCTILIHYEKGEPPNVNELRTQLESGSIEDKIIAMKRTILLLLNGEKLPQLLMSVIRFIIPTRDHALKKLTLIYWEVVEKKSPDGKLLPEMILVCNGLLGNLSHANEYIRGCTLRYICKLKEPEVLEPLLPNVRSNLEHRHSYVRRNAVLALYCIYRDFEHLCPDAPDVIANFLQQEGDPSCKRNAFLMLCMSAQDKAVDYLSTALDQVASFADVLQYAIIELIKKVSKTNPAEKSKYMRCMFSLLNSASPGVRFECANALVSLSSASGSIKAAAAAFIDLLCNQSDNNVKMIVLDRLLDLKQRHTKVLQELLLDVMRALASPSMDIRKKTLDFALDLVSPRNIDEIILVLKKEINKTQSQEEDKAAEYRQLLVQAIHSCAVKFPDVASNVVHVLLDFLGDSNVASAVDVILFVREVIGTYSDLRQAILRRLLQSVSQIKSAKVYRAALWVIGEFSITTEDIDLAFTTIKESLGDTPFLEQTEETETHETKPHPLTHSAVTRILADGTYATQSALIDVTSTSVKIDGNLTLRTLLLSGDFFLGSIVGTTLTKLVLRLNELQVNPALKHSFTAEILLILTSILRLGKSTLTPQTMDLDAYERVCLCIKTLSEPNELIKSVFLSGGRDSFNSMLTEQQALKTEALKKPIDVAVQADDLLKIRQLNTKHNIGQEDIGDEVESDLTRATGYGEKDSAEKRLNKIFQLTGFSDPIYAEAYVGVHQYDIVLDVLIINQTGDTLQNVSLELATLGDLKLCERPQNYSIGPHDRKQIKASIKVSSTETGIIFGNIVYDIAGKPSTSDKNIVILNDIHIDIMDYISPASCTDVQFRTMWAEFEWENKVAVNTTINSVIDFLNHIIRSTNMKCLTPQASLDGESGFLAANLYAKSIFGEDALANICIEKQPDGKLGGYIRIRSKTQGIALSLGDKITLKQRTVEA